MPRFEYEPGARPVGNYTIQYALGRGGFGEVYFATSPAGREVALKAILNHEAIEIRGVQNCMNLASPRLVTIFDICRDDNRIPWVVMEYIRGPSLRDILKQSTGGLGSDKALYLLRELALAVNDLHAAGLVHRDLKPGNVFFDQGRIKIGDYSLTKTISGNQQSQHTMTVGSVHYMAPEVSLGKYDKTVDIYALGVIFYEMLTGHPPHVGESVGEILMKHLQDLPDVSHLEQKFREPVLRAMNRNPEHRYPSAEEFAKTVLKISEISDLLDSFNPATLSMIGECPMDDDRHAALCETVTKTPQVIVDTNGTSLLESQNPERSPHVRVAMASAAIASVCLASAMWNNRAGIGLLDGLALTSATLLTAAVPNYLHRNSRRSVNGGKHARTVKKLHRLGVATFSALLFFLAAFFTTSIEPEGLLVTSISCWFTMSIVDWRSFVARNREPDKIWKRILSVIAILTIVLRLLDLEAWCLFSASTTIAVFLGASFLSPRLPSKSLETSGVPHSTSSPQSDRQHPNSPMLPASSKYVVAQPGV